MSELSFEIPHLHEDKPKKTKEEKIQRKKEKREHQREAQLHKLLTPEARERLSRIALVKPEKVKQIEEMIINQGQMSNFVNEMDETHLLTMLEQLRDVEPHTKIIIKRKTKDEKEAKSKDF
eukprot:TRINITY_DN2636_c1_g1_i1.p2 TRINITY_DN2636_c1_g1~~TRINITY_DN2636_c1_g1_i1.p2  ORF type:complete len:121 (-),score=43.05 TRINITY_DN2636_c1_g1_i1:46-408(-)